MARRTNVCKSLYDETILNNATSNRHHHKDRKMDSYKRFYEFPEAKEVVVSGDIHGDFNLLVHKCCVQYGLTDTLVIVAGDCGFGFEKQGYYENVYIRNRKRLTSYNNWILFVRGNHDNPAYFNDCPVKHSRWMTLPDYSVIRACGHEILCVGGAISTDRSYRMSDPHFHFQKKEEPLARNIYWQNEYPVFNIDMLDAVNKHHSIDTVVTHTAPSSCELRSRSGIANMAIRDEDLLDHVKHERQVMDKILDYLKSNRHPLRHWYYGHFHQSWHQEIDGIQYNMLDIMELKKMEDEKA